MVGCKYVRFAVCCLAFCLLPGCYSKTTPPVAVDDAVAFATANSRTLAPIPTTTAALPLLQAPLLSQKEFSSMPAPVAIPVSGGATVRQSKPLYTVVVHKVPVDEVLFALARDTTLDLNIVGDIDGEITLNAVQQPLEAIVSKIARQASLRYQLSAHSLSVFEDKPYIKTYKVDYLNISRSTSTRVDLTTQVGGFTSATEGKSADSANNGSTMSVENSSENLFWDSLVDSIKGVISNPESGEDGSELFVNREAGLITVRANSDQQAAVSNLIEKVVGSARRQVLIEATVVEVALNDNFESGVDWKLLDKNGGRAFDFAQLLTGSAQASDATVAPTGLLTFRDPLNSLGDVTATLKLLQQFGDVQVLSSPKIIALNNQTAVLKVVDNRVYFTFQVNQQQRENGDVTTTVDSTVHSVPVGLVMNVTAFISETDEVILNVRPTISRILNFAEDPGPALAGHADIKNLIPEIQVREMESLLRVNSGEVAIIGGLMQNRADKRSAGLPGLGKVPLLGRLFSHDTNTLEKTELLVFLRPTVINQSDLDHHAEHLRRYLPHQSRELLVPVVNSNSVQ